MPDDDTTLPASRNPSSFENLYLERRGVPSDAFRDAATRVAREGVMTRSLADLIVDLRNTAYRENNGINNNGLSQASKDAFSRLNTPASLTIIPDAQAGPEVATIPLNLSPNPRLSR